jgi:hypothetical protein
MVEQARVVFAKLEKLKPGAAKLAELWQEIEAADAQAASHQPEAVEEVSVEETETIAPSEEPATHPVRSKPAAGWEADQEFVPEHGAPATEPLPRMPLHTVPPAPEPVVTEYAQANAAAEPAGVLGEFVSDLEASLGDSFLPPPAPPQAPEAPPRAVREPIAAQSGHAAAAAAPAPALQPATPTFTYQPTKKRTLAPEV